MNNVSEYQIQDTELVWAVQLMYSKSKTRSNMAIFIRQIFLTLTYNHTPTEEYIRYCDKT